MRTKNQLTAGKKNKRSKYLEVHVQENGTVFFSNLSAGSAQLLEKISGKQQKSRSFYCG